jgi:RNA 2',3'-cyclic 3'-phosphodiesterase
MGGVPDARWQSDEQLHLTLRFIGEVERPQAEEIAAALGMIDRPRPVLAVRGAGMFGKSGQTRSLWAGVVRDEGLARLHDRVERALQRVGIAPDPRAFHPHITLARFPSRARGAIALPEDLAALVGTPTEIDNFVLYESSLGKNGATYTVVARYPLT